ncbi:SLC13 family permease [Candidatus Marsarchaeota archaeon]|nr:SLC13 family permease [Candidatus Marsarchaeota archaeon]MCL5404493.1 SLC13 family permease [Candidatus Marsarchaeota archaeon]
MLKQLYSLVKKEPIFFALLVAYLLLLAYNVHFLNAGLVEWNTVAIIASFIIINTGLLVSGGIDFVAGMVLSKVGSVRNLYVFSVIVTVVLSMFITNDASLIVLVPLTVSMGRLSGRNLSGIIVLQAISANVGSMLTPFGNPQNIIMFRHYALSAAGFLYAMAPAFAVSMAVLLVFTLMIGKDSRRISGSTPKAYGKTLFYSSLLLFVVDVGCFLAGLGASAFLALSAASVLLMLAFKPRSLSKAYTITRIDFFLIMSFVLIFLVINSASTILPAIHPSGSLGMFLYALLISQFISNVPATVLLQKSSLFLPLGWGVNVGGNGTLIASLANFIAYRQGRGIGILKFMKLSAIYMIVVALILIVIISL